jgi:hypothetical protein
MNTLNTPAPHAASGVTRRNPHASRRCPRCLRFGTFAPNCIVCDQCTTARPSITAVTVTVTLAVVGGGR